ncbi:MAG: carnitine O-acetyltransferase [Bacillariaceae sp.]|jgi:carnitine O-acetyltransferase
MTTLATAAVSTSRIFRHIRAAATRSCITRSSSSSSSSAAATTASMSSNTTRNYTSKPWAMKMVESHGDYRDETWLEEHHTNAGGEEKGGNLTTPMMYSNQSELPTLPITSIEDTLKRFLPTAMPLAESKDEIKALQSAIDKFPSQASMLQKRLLERVDQSKNSSWLQHWWNTLGYLQVRDSVVINVSYYFNFQDDKTLRTGDGTHNNNPVQIQRAASILYACGQYRNLVTSERLQPDTIGRNKTPLCMTAYKYMFHACRIPRSEQDSYRIYDPHVYKHAVVACRGRFFKIPLIDNITGEVISVSTLESHLNLIMEFADSAESAAAITELGYLTGDNRDVWANARTALLDCTGMSEAMEWMESGCVMLNLDSKNPVSKAECGRQYLYGNGYNRWFDKSVQLVVCPNGKAGLVGEHSMMDGMPMIGLANHIVNTSYEQARNESSSSSSLSPSGGQQFEESSISDIFGDITLSPQVLDMIETSKQSYYEWTGKHGIDVQSFQGYGSNFMKKSGFSPDAYVQMAMQVATSRLFQKQVGTYEATQTRVFLHGRTETTRTVSPASAEFVQGMNDNTLSPDEKINLLSKACASHAQYIGNASKGLGVDRHFLGLSMLVQDGERMPDLYSDPVFIRSKRWRVSTSNLTNPTINTWGYGEVVPDGVGLSYAVHKDHLMFGITALKEHGWTERLSQYLEDTLCEMRVLVESNNNNNGMLPRSKL